MLIRRRASDTSMHAPLWYLCFKIVVVPRPIGRIKNSWCEAGIVVQSGMPLSAAQGGAQNAEDVPRVCVRVQSPPVRGVVWLRPG